MRRLLLVAALVVLLAGCGDFPTVANDDEATVGEAPLEASVDPPTRSEPPSGSSSPTSGPVMGVMYDDEFVVEEGVWYLGETYPHLNGMFRGQVNGLVGAGAKGGVWVMGPALYGKYNVRIEAYDHAPHVPAWCEDVVEVSYEHATDVLTMGSFETFSDDMHVPAGTYRIRYCAAGQDVAAEETAEDEFDGDDYRLYSSRHLFQLWPSPAAHDAIIRTTSDFAADANARVGG